MASEVLKIPLYDVADEDGDTTQGVSALAVETLKQLLSDMESDGWVVRGYNVRSGGIAIEFAYPVEDWGDDDDDELEDEDDD